MKKAMKLPILFSIVLMFFLLYGLAFASDNKPPAKNLGSRSPNTHKKEPQSKKAGTPVQSKTVATVNTIKIDLMFFQNHLQKDMDQEDVVRLFGDNYRESLTDQSGEPSWTYDYPVNPSYQTKVPPYAVDEAGILTGKMRYQLFIVWNGEKIKSYIVFYNNNGTIGELKKKFFEGSYSNE